MVVVMVRRRELRESLARALLLLPPDCSSSSSVAGDTSQSTEHWYHSNTRVDTLICPHNKYPCLCSFTLSPLSSPPCFLPLSNKTGWGKVDMSLLKGKFKSIRTEWLISTLATLGRTGSRMS